MFPDVNFLWKKKQKKNCAFIIKGKTNREIPFSKFLFSSISFPSPPQIQTSIFQYCLFKIYLSDFRFLFCFSSLCLSFRPFSLFAESVVCRRVTFPWIWDCRQRPSPPRYRGPSAHAFASAHSRRPAASEAGLALAEQEQSVGEMI